MPSRDVRDCHVKLQAAFHELLLDFQHENPGKDLMVTCSYRSPQEQQQLYRLGRALIGGKWVVQDASRIVTQLSGEAGHLSLHNTVPARALDVAVLIGGKVTWNEREYYPLGALARKHRIEWGGDWQSFKDYPHLQLPKEA